MQDITCTNIIDDITTIDLGKEKFVNIDEKDIKYLVYKSDHFIVFIDSGIDVDWEIHNSFPGHGNEVKKNDILNIASTLECIPNDFHRDNIRLNYKRMIGEGITRAFQNDYENAYKILEKAENYIKKRNEEKSRYWYLLASGTFAIIILILGIIIQAFKSHILKSLGINFYLGTLGFVGGCLGALFSIILRLGNQHLDCSPGKKLHFLEGVSRIFAGGIAGVILAFLVKLEVIFSLLTKKDILSISMFVTGLISGASERLAPSIISKISTSEVKNLRENNDE